MNRHGKALITLIGLLVVLWLLSWFIATADRVSPFLWIIPAALAGIAGAVPIRYPNTRPVYVKTWHGIVEGLDALVNRASGGRYRQPIKKDVKAYVLNRAGRRCQYPRCRITNPKMLEVHHIDLNPSKSDQVNNLIVVCRNHHKRIQDDGVKIEVVRSWARNHVTDYAKGRKVAGVRG